MEFGKIKVNYVNSSVEKGKKNDDWNERVEFEGKPA